MIKKHTYIRRLKWQKLLYKVQIDQFSSNSMILHTFGVYIYMVPDTLPKIGFELCFSNVKSILPQTLWFPRSNLRKKTGRPQFRIIIALIRNTLKKRQGFSLKLHLQTYHPHFVYIYTPPKLKKNMIFNKNINFWLIFFRVGGHRPQTLLYKAFEHPKCGVRPQKQQTPPSVPI